MLVSFSDKFIEFQKHFYNGKIMNYCRLNLPFYFSLGGVWEPVQNNFFLFSLSYIFYSCMQIVSTVRTKCPQTPLVLYINGNGGILERMKLTGVDVIGLDWTVDMEDGRKRLGNDIGIQGNVDPAVLFSPLSAVADEIKRYVM